ncbi:hypothetical protein N9L68_01310 [bacterium]|nr:hypothetical protein [bacterium]
MAETHARLVAAFASRSSPYSTLTIGQGIGFCGPLRSPMRFSAADFHISTPTIVVPVPGAELGRLVEGRGGGADDGDKDDDDDDSDDDGAGEDDDAGDNDDAT